jgi:hypothetical protein
MPLPTGEGEQLMIQDAKRVSRRSATEDPTLVTTNKPALRLNVAPNVGPAGSDDVTFGVHELSLDVLFILRLQHHFLGRSDHHPGGPEKRKK